MKRLIMVAALISVALSVNMIGQKPPVAYVQAQEAPSVTSAEQTQTEDETKKVKKEVVVRRGDTLSRIAKRHDTTYQRLFDANAYIKDPDVIDIGDTIRIPDPDEKLQKRKLPAGVVVATPSRRTTYQRSGYRNPGNTPSVRSVSTGGVWDRLAACESGGNWNINTGNGYYGGLQFSLSTWQGVGGSGYPHQASRSEQIRRGKILQSSSGWGQWPACSAKLGLR